MSNAMSSVWQIISLIFEYAWKMPFQVPFFFFPFSFGHLIWGSITISISIAIMSKIIKGSKGWKDEK